jgi:hypothetical protein
MRMIKTLIAGGAGLAALGAASPAASQYPYGYSNGYGNGYSNGYSSYGYGAYGANTNVAASQCTAAVQNRLYNRTSLGSILGSLVGVPQTTGRVLSITQVTANNGYVRVRGLASSGRMAYNNYSPYGVGAYGALGYGYNQSADLSFKCDVDYRGYVRDVDINRRY